MDTITTTLPQANCVRNLDEIIEAAVLAGDIRPGVIAQWAGCGGDIVIKGKLRTKSCYFPRWCIRWTCSANGSKGLFGKGLAGYDGPEYDPEQLKNLEVTK